MEAPDFGFDYEACFKRNPAFKKSDIAELRSWIEGLENPKYIPRNISDKQLLLFHNACLLVIENTKKCIKTYFSIKEKDPEHFDERTFNLPLVKDAVKYQEFSVIPQITDDGYHVIFHRLHDGAPDKYHFNSACKVLFMTIDKCLYEHGPQNGIIFLFDMTGVKLGHLTRVNLISLGKFFTYIQDAMPAHIMKIHILNVVPFFDKLMMLFKPFIKKELISMMALHPHDMDMEKFYKEAIPRKCLPSDFGGDLPCTQVLNAENTEGLMNIMPYFKAENEYLNIYTKSSKKKTAKEIKEFRNLNID